MKSSVLRALLLLLAALGVSPLPSEAYTVQERAITALASDAVHPAIWGDTVIWKDYRAGGAYLVGYDYPTIYSYNLVTGREERITGPEARVYNLSNRGRTDIDIWENRIVWGDYRNAGTTKGDVYLYDMVTGAEQRITTNPATNYFPAIHGNLIAYRDFRNDTGSGNDDIYLYDLATGRETQVTSELAVQKYPQVYNTTVVWEDFRNSGYSDDIYLYDAATGTERRLTTNAGSDQVPNIFGTKVVFWSYDGIHLIDLLTGAETRVTSSRSEYGDISDTFIVWEDYRNDPLGDIYGYDLASGTVFPICIAPGEQLMPAIYGNHVTWMDKRNGNWDIYEADIFSGQGDLVTFEVPEPSSFCLMAAGACALGALVRRRGRRGAQGEP